MVRCEPGVYGRLASEPTASRVIQTLGGGADKAARSINKTSACVRERAWDLAGSHAPDHACTAKKPLIIDLDATLLTSHSDKEQARPTLKRGYGFHPLCAFVDHGQGETGEPRAVAAQHVWQRFSEGEYVWSDAFTVGTTESITGPETSLRETIEAPVVRTVGLARTLLALSDVDHLVADYEGGVGVRELAEKYGIHRATVFAHLRPSKVPRRGPGLNEHEQTEAVRPSRDGLSMQAIGRQMGVDRKAVRAALVPDDSHSNPARSTSDRRLRLLLAASTRNADIPWAVVTHAVQITCDVEVRAA